MHIRLLILFLLSSIFSIRGYAQNTITGNLSQLKNQTIRLVGFSGLGIYTIDSTQVNEQGTFALKYGDKDSGMGYITAR